MKTHHYLASLIIGLALSACSTTKTDPMDTVQFPNDAWWNESVNPRSGKLIEANTLLNEVPPEFQKNLAIVRSKVEAVSPILFAIGFSESNEINVFSSMQNGQNLIVFSGGFMRLFGADQDVLATVLGHEIGHHKLGHTQQDYAKNRNLMMNIASQTLGMISSYFIPFSGLLVGNAVKGAGLSYSRDDERGADTFGMKLALSAGYSPCGSYRFAMMMGKLNQGPSLAFFSTHPGNDERIENAQEFTASENLNLCQ